MSSLGRWIAAQRTSVRLAFILRVGTMGLNAILSLLWTRALLGVLGPASYGILMSFQAVTRLGGLGDFGLSGAVAVRVGQAMGRGDYEGLKTFLPAARALLLLAAGTLCVVFLITAPWLPNVLGFKEVIGSGSMVFLFATGGPAILIFLASGYVNSLNLAHGTVTWPLIPTFVVGQLGMAAIWLGAIAGLPLWVQHLATVSVSGINLWVGWWMLKVSHPWLGHLLPLAIDRQVWRDLGSASVWMYLYSVGNAVYASTDRLLINAGFGAAMVPIYLVNAKLCELIVQLVASGAAVSLPKIVRWISSPDIGDRNRVILELRRLSIFQTAIGTSAALIYLVFNNAFVRVWLGEEYVSPPLWQFAFALNLAITAGTDSATQTAGMCGRDGLRLAGITFGITALLNLGLSFVAMQLGSIAGIAFATVLAQAVTGLSLAWVTTRYLNIPFADWALRGCVLPAIAVFALYIIQCKLPSVGVESVALGLIVALVIAIVFCRCIGLNRDLVRHEFRSVLATLKR